MEILVTILLAALFNADVSAETPHKMSYNSSHDRMIGVIRGEIEKNTTGFVHTTGELYGGGIVVAVWREAEIEKGLIASLVDLSTGTAWSNLNTTLIGTLAQNPDDGKANTSSIINQSGHLSSAAKLCDDYISDGFSDWHLPSSRELNLCYNSAAVVNKTLGAKDGFQYAYYRSSTEESADKAWGELFFSGDVGNIDVYSKNSSFSVRAVRRF